MMTDTLIDGRDFPLTTDGLDEIYLEFMGLLRRKNADRYALADRAAAACWEAYDTGKPTAAIAWGEADPDFAKHLLPDYRLRDVVRVASVMTENTHRLLAKVIGMPQLLVKPKPNAQRRALLRRFLQIFPGEAVLGTYESYGDGYHAIRPIGRDWDGDQHIITRNIQAFQWYFRESSEGHQALIASLIWLFNRDGDEPWLEGLDCDWHAVDAVRSLRKAGLLKEWARLIILAPDWHRED